MNVPAQKPIILRQSIYNQIPLLLLVVCSFCFMLWSSVHYSWAVQMLDVGSWSIPIPLGGIIFLVLAVALLHKLHSDKLIITNEYLLFLTGCYTWREKSIRLEYHFIREIEIDQTLLQKLFGVGDIMVTIVATSLDSSKKLRGVRNPRHVKDLLYAYLKSSREEARVE